MSATGVALVTGGRGDVSGCTARVCYAGRSSVLAPVLGSMWQWTIPGGNRDIRTAGKATRAKPPLSGVRRVHWSRI